MGILRFYSGPVGIMLLASGAGAALFTPGFRAAGYLMLGAGAFLLAASLYLNRGDFVSLLKGRTVRHGANAAVYSLVVFMIVAAVNFLAVRHGTQFDLTEEGLNTLSDQTVRLLRGLDGEIEVTGFFSSGNPDRGRFEDLASAYRRHSDKLAVKVVDPLRSPGEARRLEVSDEGTVVVQAAGGEARVSRVGEEELTNAILRATRDEKKPVCFTSGHGEPALTDGQPLGYMMVSDSLRKEAYLPRELLLLREAEVPQDCGVVVVAGPETPLMASEVQALSRYMDRGGRLLVLKRDPKRVTGLDSLLAEHGLRVNEDVIVDRLSRALSGDEFVPVVTQYDAHAATEVMTEKRVASFFTVASSVEALEPSIKGVRSQVVARTSANAWGETGSVGRFDESEDNPGPVGVMAVASGPASGSGPSGEEPSGAGTGADPEAVAEPQGGGPRAGGAEERRIVLFGDSDFASNAYLSLSGNSDLFLNSVAWLADDADLISIRSKRSLPQPVTLTAGGQNLLSLITFALPLAAVISGAAVWLRRKRL